MNCPRCESRMDEVDPGLWCPVCGVLCTSIDGDEMAHFPSRYVDDETVERLRSIVDHLAWTPETAPLVNEERES